MNLPDFVLMVPGETVALILLLALLAGVGVWVHLTNPPPVDVDDSLSKARQELNH